MRSANNIEAEIRRGHFHFLVWESFSVDVQKLFVFGPKTWHVERCLSYKEFWTRIHSPEIPENEYLFGKNLMPFT